MCAVADPPTETESASRKPLGDNELECCFIAHDADEICRVCSCTPDRACVRQGEACGWAEPGLCTACAPGAKPGWKHPDRETLGCQNAADFEIEDLEDNERHNPSSSLAITHACTEHVGDMLGHAGEGSWEDGDPERWEVRAL